MQNLDYASVEKEIVKAITEIKTKLKIEIDLEGDCCPGNIISSQILLTVMGRIAKSLGIIIPDNRYIFHERTKKTQTQLTIKQSAQKLIKIAKHGNK
ncbi:MAG TPA: hypothetical protein VK787_07335 [Puia sp.]|jgi:hypothetical protein|nr:hypothetical protein [Puia sp.]